MSNRLKSNGWSSEPPIWQELAGLTQLLSWKRIPFDSSRSHRVPEHDTGVYLICVSPPFGTLKKLNAYTVLYAGQVKSHIRGFRTRFSEHLKRPNATLKMFLDCYYSHVDFWFAHVHDPSQIDSLEGLLIDTFNPPCNSIRAPGSLTLVARLGTARRIGEGRNRPST